MSRHESVAMTLCLSCIPVMVLTARGTLWPLAAWVSGWVVLLATKEPQR